MADRKSIVISSQIRELLTRLNFDNFEGNIQTLSFSATNTPTTFNHTLRRVPKGYLVVGQKQAGNIYYTSSDKQNWNKTTIVLRASNTGDYCVIIL